MKLRNKKTGQEGNFIINKDHLECVDLDCVPLYFSLSELLDEWEDYTPRKPLIKDEKIRKAVRAWADALDIDELYINYIGDNTYIELYEDPARKGGWNRMSLPNQENIKKNERYTISELCGEEEE